MKKLIRAVASVSLSAPLVIYSMPSLAQWTGASDTAATSHQDSKYAAKTVAEVKGNPQDDMKVVLVGTIVRKLASERYLFTDGTGQIEVEIDDKDFPKEPVNEKTRLRIEGEVDTHKMRDADIEADRVVVVK